ncbi:MAG: aspartate carbamoyltransferase [Deltaproteobacteria bacterium]|nr:aspartate carbamoyltransferase [Deltaproteobacteria bacterium]
MTGRDLLGIEGLDRTDLERILETAERMQEVGRRDVKKVPTLRGRTLINLFFEASTRTRTSFEIAGKRLSADVVNFTPSSSSLTKAESILDTAMTLDAMDPDAVIVRHKVAGVPKRIADALAAPVINAGDGAHEHPTQALLDCFTVKQEKGRFDGLTVTIIGDITHSRVARSNLYAFTKLGAEVRLAAPPTMLPTGIESLGAKAYTSLREALEGADVVMVLRIQQERLDGQPRRRDRARSRRPPPERDPRPGAQRRRGADGRPVSVRGALGEARGMRASGARSARQASEGDRARVGVVEEVRGEERDG